MSDHRCNESTRPKGKLLYVGPKHASGLPEAHRITAYLPPGYDESDRDHSLAIFFDGQNMFDDLGSYRGGWQLHRLIDYRACRGEPVPIAVTIHTDGWSRSSILSPWARDGAPPMGDRMLEWITGWLIPTVRAEARVRPGPEGVLIGGSSLGGLLSLYAFFRHPEHFGRVVAMSPALGVGDGLHGPIFDYVYRSQRRGGKVYLDAGEQECQCSNITRHTGDMAGLLAHKGYRGGVDLLFRLDPEGSHDEQSWKRRLPGALDFICH